MVLKGDLVEKRGCCSLEWKIKDFFTNPLSYGELWSSPSFYLSNASWCLCLDLCPVDECISVFLRKEQSLIEAQKLSYFLCVKASDGTMIRYRKDASVITESRTIYGYFKLCKMEDFVSKKRKLFADDALIIFCEARIIGGGNEADAESQIDCRDNFCGLSQNFKDLFLNEADTDVTIKVKNKMFHAHSQILSARSSVLAGMVRHDTEENTGIVEIPDCDQDAFREFLIFLYSGQVENLTSENVIALYSAADKFKMKDLKTCCCEFIKENMSVHSFCSYFSLAITNDEKNLIKFLTNYFAENVKKIIVSVEFMSFAEQCPVQKNELFIRIAERVAQD